MTPTIPQRTAPTGWHPNPEGSDKRQYVDGDQGVETRAEASVPAQREPRNTGAPVRLPAAATEPFWMRRSFIAVCATALLFAIASVMGGGSAQPEHAGSRHQAHSVPAGPHGDAARNDSARPHVLDPRPGVPHQVQPGSAFVLGNFKILPGWRLKSGASGMGYVIDGLEIQNVSQRISLFRAVVTLHRAPHAIVADLRCSSGFALAQQIVNVTCVGEGSRRSYDRVTITNGQ